MRLEPGPCLGHVPCLELVGLSDHFLPPVLFFIRRLSQRTVVMHQGRIIRDYRTEEFLADEHLQAINGLDYTYKNKCYQVIQECQQGREEI